MFDDEFFNTLPSDPIVAAHKISNAFCIFDGGIPDRNKQEFLEHYLTAMGAFQAFADAYALNFDFPELSGDREHNTREIRKFFYTLRDALDAEVARLTVEEARSKFSNRFARISYFEISDDNLKKLQLLFSSIRYEVERNQSLSEDVRWRILKKLELTEAKTQRKMVDLDRLWGFMGEIRVILTGSGTANSNNDTRTILDRINEIARITRIVQANLISSAPEKTAANR